MAACRMRWARAASRRSARVVSISQDAVFVDLGAKAEGVLDVAEVRADDGKLIVAVGDIVEARVVDAATDPPAEAILAVIQAAAQVVLADQNTNPAFNTCVETTAPFEPGLFLVTASLG